MHGYTCLHVLGLELQLDCTHVSLLSTVCVLCQTSKYPYASSILSEQGCNEKATAYRGDIVLPGTVSQHPKQPLTDTMVAVSEGNQVVVAAIQASQQDRHVICLATRIDKIRHLGNHSTVLNQVATDRMVDYPVLPSKQEKTGRVKVCMISIRY